MCSKTKVDVLVEFYYKVLRSAMWRAEQEGHSLDDIQNDFHEMMVRGQLDGEPAMTWESYHGYLLGRFEPAVALDLSILNEDEYLSLVEEAVNIIGGNLA